MSAKSVFITLILAIVYFVTARFGLAFDAVSGFATLVWPPTGLSLAALLLFGYRVWPGVALGALAANVSVGAPIFVASGIAFGNTMEALVGAYFLRRFTYFDITLQHLQSVFGLIGFAAVLSTFISATVGVATLWLGGIIAVPALVATWGAWWVGDMLGNLIVAPFLFVWCSPWKFEFSWNHIRLLENAFFAVIFFIVNFLMFGSYNVMHSRPFMYIVFLPLLWAAIRYGQHTGTLAVVATTVAAIWGTVYGLGPFVYQTLSERLFHLQLFMGTVSATSLIVSAAIKERRKAVQVLEDERTNLADLRARDAAVLASIGDGLIVADRAGKILFVNTVFENLLGWRKEEVLGKHLIDVVPLEDETGKKVPFEKRMFKQALSGEKIITDVSSSFYYVKKDASRVPVRIIVTPVVVNGVTVGVVDLFHDITAEKEIEKVRRDFLSLASHQLRTPLSGTKWLIETLNRKILGPVTKKQKEYLDNIYEINEQMIRLVYDMLNALRFESGAAVVKKEVVSIPQLYAELLAKLSSAAQSRKVTLSSRLESNAVLRVETDKELLRSILETFVSNALQYSSPGQQVTLDAKEETTAIVCSVKDDGIGIPVNEQKHIFERFYRATNAKEFRPTGTGLGLYISAMLAEKMGAEILFDSEVGKGSVFYLRIPKIL